MIDRSLIRCSSIAMYEILPTYLYEIDSRKSTNTTTYLNLLSLIRAGYAGICYTDRYPIIKNSVGTFAGPNAQCKFAYCHSIVIRFDWINHCPRTAWIKKIIRPPRTVCAYILVKSVQSTINRLLFENSLRKWFYMRKNILFDWLNIYLKVPTRTISWYNRIFKTNLHVFF